MTTITVEVPDALADDIRRNKSRLPEIIENGLRGSRVGSTPVTGSASEVYAFFAQNPTPDQVMAIRPSRAFQTRIDFLLAKSKDRGLTPKEETEWEEYELAEHLVRVAKARAYAKLQAK